jgi:hypothetical protein
MDGLGGQDLSAAFEYLALTLAAGTLTAASGRQVNTCFAHGVEEGTSRGYFILFVSVNDNFNIARRYQVFLSHQKDSYENQYYNEEYCYRY